MPLNPIQRTYTCKQGKVAKKNKNRKIYVCNDNRRNLENILYSAFRWKTKIIFLLYLNTDRSIVDLDLVRPKYVYIALFNRFILKTYNQVYTIETLISSFDR